MYVSCHSRVFLSSFAIFTRALREDEPNGVQSITQRNYGAITQESTGRVLASFSVRDGAPRASNRGEETPEASFPSTFSTTAVEEKKVRFLESTQT